MRQLGLTVSLFAVLGLPAMATNGDALIAVGAKARGMGGVGIAFSHGAESALANPALITSTKGTQISFGGTVFMPDIETTIHFRGDVLPPEGYRSDADLNLIPEVSLAHKLNEHWYIGVGMWGTAGMGTDYSRRTVSLGVPPSYGNLQMVTNLQLMQFAVPIAYKTQNVSIAFSPIVQYGNLDINYKMPDLTTGNLLNIGAGLAQDFGFGWSAGVDYRFGKWHFGAVYKSKIAMDYTGQLQSATAPFAPFFGGKTIGDRLTQPAEYGIGIAYASGSHAWGIDLKRIDWGDARGYRDFGWKSQNVFAAGYQYSHDSWSLRAGFNYGPGAVTQADTTSSAQAAAAGSALNFFNLLGFPATAQRHITLGGTYRFNETFSFDLALVHALNTTETYATPAFAAAPPNGFGVEAITTDHAETGVTFQLNYRF